MDVYGDRVEFAEFVLCRICALEIGCYEGTEDFL